MTGHSSFWDQLSIHFLASLEKQHKLDRLTRGLGAFEFDRDQGVLRFNGIDPLPMQILGTHSESDSTWLWAWENKQSAIDPRFLESSLRLREFGQKHSMDLLTTGKWSVEQADGYALSLLAAGVCEADGFYRCPYPGGAAFVLVTDERIRRQPGFNLESLRQPLGEMLNWMDEVPRYPVNMRTAFLNYPAIASSLRELKDKLVFTMDGEDVIAGFGKDESLSLLYAPPAMARNSIAEALQGLPAVVAEGLPEGWKAARYRTNQMIGGSGGDSVEWSANGVDFQRLDDFRADVFVKIGELGLAERVLWHEGIDTVRVVLAMKADGSFEVKWRGKKEPDEMFRATSGQWKPIASTIQNLSPSVTETRSPSKPWWKFW